MLLPQSNVTVYATVSHLSEKYEQHILRTQNLYKEVLAYLFTVRKSKTWNVCMYACMHVFVTRTEYFTFLAAPLDAKPTVSIYSSSSSQYDSFNKKKAFGQSGVY